MENAVKNPYKAPEAEVAVNNASGKLVAVYNRFSAWGVFGLSLITFGIYFYYWMVNRTNKINAYVENPISTVYMVVTIALLVLANVLTYAAPLMGILSLAAIAPLFSILGGILLVVWIYKLRNRIHAYTNAQKGTYAWIGPIKTFFFTCWYLQYKINKIIDNE